MHNPIHTALVRYSLPTWYKTARNPACDRQTDPFSVLDASPPSGEPGWFSEGTGRGRRNAQRGVFGNGVTSVARGPVNRETGALGGFLLRERWSPGTVFNAVSERPWGSHTADGSRLAAK